jgi:hypothetical protein
MSDAISLRFESKLRAPAERVWEWITSIEGISAEMWPFFLTTPASGAAATQIRPAPLSGATSSCSVSCPLIILT